MFAFSPLLRSALENCQDMNVSCAREQVCSDLSTLQELGSRDLFFCSVSRNEHTFQNVFL